MGLGARQTWVSALAPLGTGPCSKPCSAHRSDRHQLPGHLRTQGVADRRSRLAAPYLAVRWEMFVPCVYHSPVFRLPSNGGEDGAFVVQKCTPQYILLSQGCSANEQVRTINAGPADSPEHLSSLPTWTLFSATRYRFDSKVVLLMSALGKKAGRMWDAGKQVSCIN